MKTFPLILGWDVSGVVEEVGFGVTTLEPGDEVYAMPWFPRLAGAYAECARARPRLRRSRPWSAMSRPRPCPSRRLPRGRPWSTPPM